MQQRQLIHNREPDVICDGVIRQRKLRRLIMMAFGALVIATLLLRAAS